MFQDPVKDVQYIVILDQRLEFQQVVRSLTFVPREGSSNVLVAAEQAVDTKNKMVNCAFTIADYVVITRISSRSGRFRTFQV